MKQVKTESGEVIWVGNGVLDQCKRVYEYPNRITEEMLLKTCM